MSETGGLKAIEVPSFCWLSSNCNKINEKTTEVWNCDKGRFSKDRWPTAQQDWEITVPPSLEPGPQDQDLTGVNSVKPR